MKKLKLILFFIALAFKVQANPVIQGQARPSELVVYKSFDSELIEIIKKLLKRYRSDYSSVIVLDNDTGKVLAAVDYIKKVKQFSQTLSFSATHPAASLMKIVTAATLIEEAGVSENMAIPYSGKSTTLYKYQLRGKRNKWTRNQRFDKAFASSNNVIFGKLAISELSAFEIFKMAEKFKFNDSISTMIENSKMTLPQTEYHLAEIASGLNRDVYISPMHGALMAQTVARGGNFITPQFEEEINKEAEFHEVFSKDTADKISNFMKLTVNKGTARSAFRKFKRRYGANVAVGGKTGTITGGQPFGRRDWFVAFVQPKSEKIKIPSISLCVMNINVKKWYVKSSFLAENIISRYIRQKSL